MGAISDLNDFFAVHSFCLPISVDRDLMAGSRLGAKKETFEDHLLDSPKDMEIENAV